MSWRQVSVLCPAPRVSRVSDIMEAWGAVAVTLQDATGGAEPGAPSDSVAGWDVTRITGLLEGGIGHAALIDALGREAPLGRARMEELPGRDWSRAWRAGIGPTRFGRRLWVCPSWSDPPGGARDSDAIVVRLDPGLAFGTGRHPSTALCLEYLEGAEIQGAEVVDYGCGSGILALAGACLGAERVWAVDDDPRALDVTRENAEANGVAGRINVVAPGDLPPVSADLLAANILANPLIALAPRFGARVRAGGTLLLSGLLADQTAAVGAAYDGWFELDPAVRRNDWAMLIGRRRRR